MKPNIYEIPKNICWFLLFYYIIKDPIKKILFIKNIIINFNILIVLRFNKINI